MVLLEVIVSSSFSWGWWLRSVPKALQEFDGPITRNVMLIGFSILSLLTLHIDRKVLIVW